LAIVFESTTGNFRDGLFADYKANRKQTPDEVSIQMKLARDIFPLMGVPVIWSDGFEADDVLCAYAANPGKGWKVAMCSSDKDLGQCIGPQAVQIDPNGWKYLDEAGVVEKFGVTPALVPEYLALMGDGVDNIPGVDKVGHKTAGKLLNKHGSIDVIYKNLDELTPAIKKGFEEARERIPQLLQLTRADLNAPKSMTPDEIYAANRNPDWAAALEKLRPLAMGKLIMKAEKGLAAMEAKARRTPAPK
jgi:DNA polymerase-1